MLGLNPQETVDGTFQGMPKSLEKRKYGFLNKNCVKTQLKKNTGENPEKKEKDPEKFIEEISCGIL